jgi:S1-C subfamily serine protease
MLSNELVSSFISIHARLFSPYFNFIAYLAFFFAVGCISTPFMHLDIDKDQYKSDYLICKTQAKNQQTIPSSISFTLMINKWIKGVITDEFSDCMKGKGWEQATSRDFNSNVSGNVEETRNLNKTALSIQPENSLIKDGFLAAYSGTGFLFSAEDYVITNWHVVRGNNNIKVKFLNGENIKAKVALKDPQNDIAFLKLERQPQLPPSDLKLGDSSKMKMGDEVFTIGYPVYWLLGKNPKYTKGEVNALSGIKDNPKVFQISVQIQPGNSGGPLFNSKGEVIGIMQAALDPKVAIGTYGTLPQNVNYAIKSRYISALLPMLPETFIASRGIAVVATESENALANFIEKAKKNIVLIEATE